MSTAFDLLDAWLETRGFINRTPTTFNLYGVTVVSQHTCIFNPHKKNDWLATVRGKDLKMTIWGPGVLNYGLATSVNLANPDSLDEVAAVISAWRKNDHALMTEVCRYVKQIEHRTTYHPTRDLEHWLRVLSPQFGLDQWKFKDMNRKILKVLRTADIDLSVPASI